jgi:hypothetical protein
LKIGTGDAYTTAVTSCGEPVATGTIQATLVHALQASRQNFVNHRRADSEEGKQIKQLTEKRRARVNDANNQFKTATAAANDALRKALGDKAEPAV